MASGIDKQRRDGIRQRKIRHKHQDITQATASNNGKQYQRRHHGHQKIISIIEQYEA